MWSRSGTKAIGVVVVIAAAVAGCAEIYYDRRETHRARRRATRSRPTRSRRWSIRGRAHSANNQIAFNGERMQSAQDRYNRGKVITPVLPTQASQ